jgi:hypothetical protein
MPDDIRKDAARLLREQLIKQELAQPAPAPASAEPPANTPDKK